ncbi:calcium binding protein [Vibrio vulnificus]|uniref:biofilm matrix calcium-binding repeat protein CabA n=1 Tax=Vibrio vulnificus TaxID=672 RepID=UPI0001F5B632|nr:biofilm matrix calcium-binding repeat protein CabA [Vibrio vulnificus]ADV88362.1 structural elements / cell exterior surface polysaccharides/antigens [Vibrio vulnificus MO6-24/O]AUJ37496.1 calcium-binding protein [Vibrio vulnificus]EGR0040039.1 biofilm matrix calcium-binding repeat protein CabA [Vibrio vulnificus]EGR0082889.1 biofilm matrix calcium-binding repeat protein CabA [Vibrio vulnificus]EGR0090828.1 biofilm matrix calcium-binding repeat protein CabA [Vibrio vulnificus]
MAVYSGTADVDVLSNYTGSDDKFVGHGDNDNIVGGGGNDLIIGGAGDDRLVGGRGDDILKAGLGDDYLGGGSGDDLLLGLYGNNHMNGGLDNDVLVAGSGDNVLIGGQGADKFIFTDKFDGHGTAKVVDFTIGEDTVRIDSATIHSLDDLSVSYDAVGNLVFSDGGAFTVKLIGVTEADFVAHADDMFQF